MPRGSKPKVYPADLVARVRQAYECGRTQAEIAAVEGVSQKVIFSLMRRHGLPCRVAAKREQHGPTNDAWKGDAANYSALHLRVQTERGRPSLCEECGTTSAKRFEWANISGRYEDVADYRRLCCSCHHRMDGLVRNLGDYAKRKEVCP